MELVLVRHAQPQWDRDLTTQVDPGLTVLGVQQAEVTAARLADQRFDRVLVSAAARARATAEPLLERRGASGEHERDWLHEIRVPADWEGTPSEEVGRVLRDARTRPRDDWWEGLPGGESFRDFHARVTTGLTRELAELGVVRGNDGLWRVEDDTRLLLVAHAGTNSVVLGHLLGLDPEPWEWERFASNHASLTVLRSTPIAGEHIFSLQQFSDVSHLPPELVTA